MDLAEAELRIVQAKRELAKQQDRLDRVKGGLEEGAAKEALLIAMEASLASLVHYRDVIAHELNAQAYVSRSVQADSGPYR